MRYRVYSFFQAIRRCQNCARIGHSTAFCRSLPACSNCSMGHLSSVYKNETIRCINCEGDHRATDCNCPAIEHFKIINTIMAYTNSSRAVARRIMGTRDISSIKQTENALQFQAYLAWNLRELDSVSQYNNDQTFLAYPPPNVVNHPAAKSAPGRLRPFRVRNNSKGEDSIANVSGVGLSSRVMPLCSIISNDPPNQERGEAGHKNLSGNGVNPPLGSNPNLDFKSLSARNNPAVGLLLGELFFIIKSKKELQYMEYCIRIGENYH